MLIGCAPEVPIGSESTPTATKTTAGSGRFVFTRFPNDGSSAQLGVHDLGSGATAALVDEGYHTQSPASSAATGEVAYVSTREQFTQLYVLDVAGNARQLTRDDSNKSAPDWSPDGTQVAYVAKHLGDVFSQLEVVGADGAGRSVVWEGDGEPTFPRWAPDGETVLFSVLRGGRWRLFELRLEDGRATPLLESLGENFGGVFSPDGSRIALSLLRDGNSDVFVVDRDGSNLTRLTDDPGPDSVSDWSDDDMILFARAAREEAEYDIWMIDADGHDETLLVGGPTGDQEARWLRAAR